MQTKSLKASITHQLAPLFRRVSRVHNEVLAGYELRAVEAHILVALWVGGPVTVREIQRTLAIQGSTLTGALDRLEKRELLSREPVEGDRRSYRLVPAKWSERRKQELSEAFEAAEAACYGGLTKAERVQLLRLATKANRALAQKE